MNLPSKEDMNVYGSSDEATAVEHFYNKTLEEAQALFRADSMLYQEDLMWMGPKAFAFYLQAAVNYLRSDEAAGDDEFVSALYAIIEYRSSQGDFPLAIKSVRELTDYVIDNYQKFNVYKEIYGDLLGEYKHLRDQLQAMN